MIDGDWKLVRRGPPILGPDSTNGYPEPAGPAPKVGPLKIELFNLSNDPGETNDLSGERPEIAERLLVQLSEFRSLRHEGGVPPMTEPTPKGWKAPKDWAMRARLTACDQGEDSAARPPCAGRTAQASLFASRPGTAFATGLLTHHRSETAALHPQ